MSSRKRGRIEIEDDEEEEVAGEGDLVDILREQPAEEGTLGDLLQMFETEEKARVAAAVDTGVRTVPLPAASSSSSTAADDDEPVEIVTRTGIAQSSISSVDARVLAMTSRLVHSSRPHASHVHTALVAARPEDGLGNIPTDTHAAMSEMIRRCVGDLLRTGAVLPRKQEVFADPERQAGVADNMVRLSASYLAALLITAGARPARVWKDGALKFDSSQTRLGPPCNLGSHCRGMDAHSTIRGMTRPTPFQAFLSPTELIRFENDNVLPRDVVDGQRSCVACRLSAVTMFQVQIASFNYEAPQGLLAQTLYVDASEPNGEFRKQYCHLPSETGWNGLSRPVVMWLPGMLSAYQIEGSDVCVVVINELLQPGVNPTNFPSGGAPKIL